MTIWWELRFVRYVSSLRFEIVILRYAINAIIATALCLTLVVSCSQTLTDLCLLTVQCDSMWTGGGL